MGNCLILMKNYDKPRTETYAVTSKVLQLIWVNIIILGILTPVEYQM